jgi:uncharacterized protein (DUF305 family)
MTNKILICLAALLLASLLAGCGGDDEDESSGAAASSSAVPFDRAFIDAMVAHHESAIEMAEAAKAEGLGQADLVKIAGDIIRTQQAEIGQMKGWRQEWFGSSEIDPEGAEALPLSEAEMGMQHMADDLVGAEDVDQAFASMMIDHHEGAVRMAELAVEQGRHAEIRDLAKRIIAAQEREIEIMQPHAEGEHHG